MKRLHCRHVEMVYRESASSPMADKATGEPLQPGDVFYHPHVLDRFPHWLAPNYWRQNAHRPPIVAILPDKSFFMVDELPSSKGMGQYGEGYDADTLPQITLVQEIKGHPSGWTGWLADGELLDPWQG